MCTALIVIDVQNDYFAEGAFPLWGAEAALARIEQAIAAAQARQWPVILVQHIASAPGPFFNRDTPGVAMHPRILAAAPDAPIVVKTEADSFFATTLASTLAGYSPDALLICGMMTHNCVTHTALSPAASTYAVSVLSDACATVSDILHRIALRALTLRVPVHTVAQAMG